MSTESSDDDMPLSRSNGHVSAARISKAEDSEMDKTFVKGKVAPVSIRNGPVTDDPMDVDGQTNGASKRKSRSSLGNKPVSYKDASDDSDDGAPLAKRQKANHRAADSDDDDVPLSKRAKLPPSIYETRLPDDSDSDDDEPLNLKMAKKKAAIEKKASSEAKAIRANEAKSRRTSVKKEQEDDSDDEPLAKAKAKPAAKRQSNGTSSAKKTNGVKKADSDSDEPLSKAKKPAAKGKATPAKSTAASKKATPAKKGSSVKKEAKQESEEAEGGDEEEEEYRWWDAPKKEDDSIKWTNLEHNGVMFPPPYEPLPKNVKLLYDSVPLELHVEAEEVATFYGSMLNSEVNTKNPTFNKNFFNGFKEKLKQTGGAKDKKGNKVDVKEFEKLDFQPIFAHYQAMSEAKKARSKEEKKLDKEERDKLEEPFKFCKWDGRKEKVGNFRVEPPGLFRGRGEHPKTGTIKERVMPEQVTINIGKDAPVPAAPPGHKWKAVQHDNKATWLAMWQENVNGNYKYVMLAANSAVKGQADFKKFEKARELKKHIDKIRRDYTKDLRSEVMADRQRATAMYFIDKLALRAGNEKDTENEAETVGCCSLKFENVTLVPPNTVYLDFLGKDSIRFEQEVEVEPQVFKNLKMFKKPPKEEGDDIFDRLNTSQLNKHLSSYMTGLTAKVFRTYNASYTMSTLLQELDGPKIAKMTDAEKLKAYNDCNRRVAILCNHKRSAPTSHGAQMEKLGDRIKGQKYQKWRTKMMILDLDPKQKKKKGADFFQREEELTDEWVKSHQQFLVEEKKTAITKKFERDNEKLVKEGGKKMPDKELKERLKVASELEAKFKKENKTHKVEAEGRGITVEKLEANIEKIEERIRNLEIQAADRDGNKEVALGTSKINYIDPRLTVVFCNKAKVGIEKFFSKTLRDKFNWAIQSVGDDAEWEF
ncbi:DNA topoisomerase 1 [Magnaporthiopsis poae ATCC 64411]|uniref:DNA topoisomerase I n=1 Tax=Magnaporthiopsis poae (strain ATCC 64411 / 73-15) TaxID=644358 RepID=A0A0C4DWH9_MAGP6|nr:DNA topoisomerase 1 [Magnaporthiopsis poae ATCC 64411]